MRFRVLALTVTLAALAVAGGAASQGFDRATAQVPPPPVPPATFWGNVSGVPQGWHVVALVVDGSKTTTCGFGQVTTSGSQTVYVVDVVADAQVSGCGAPGRTVRFYFAPPSATGGRLANESEPYPGAGPKQKDLTAGPQFGNIAFAPMTTRN